MDEAQIVTVLHSAPVVDSGSTLSAEEVDAIPWPMPSASSEELRAVRDLPVPVSDSPRAPIPNGQPHAQHGAVVAVAGNSPPTGEELIVADAQQEIALDRECLHELRSTFCAGIFRVHYEYETRIAHRLMHSYHRLRRRCRRLCAPQYRISCASCPFQVANSCQGGVPILSFVRS